MFEVAECSTPSIKLLRKKAKYLQIKRLRCISLVKTVFNGLESLPY